MVEGSLTLILENYDRDSGIAMMDNYNWDLGTFSREKRKRLKNFKGYTINGKHYVVQSVNGKPFILYEEINYDSERMRLEARGIGDIRDLPNYPELLRVIELHDREAKIKKDD